MLQDLRYAIRTLLKAPGFPAVAVLTLALGIGANTAMFSVVEAVLLARLPYPHPDQLVQLWETRDKGRLMQVSGLNFHDWREQMHSMQGLAISSEDLVSVSGSFAPRRAWVHSVSRDFFRIMGTDAFRGHTFTADEASTGGAPVAVINYDFWQSALGGSDRVLGEPVRLNGMAFTVVGVMPPGFEFPEHTQLWIPTELFPDTSARSAHNYKVYGRLKPDMTIASGQADMNAIAGRLAKQYVDDKDHGIRVVSLHEQIVGSARPALLILLGAVGFVLVIACANIANLQMARASSRVRELALRAALGAGRRRLIRQLLTESILLSVAGGLSGFLLAMWGTAFLRSTIPGSIPRVENIAVDIGVLAFSFAISVVAALLFGVLPAIAASHTDVNEALKEGSAKSTSGPRRRTFGGALVVGEIAMATVMLAGAALLVESFWKLERVDPGFRSAGLLTAEISWPVVQRGEVDKSRALSLSRRLLERVRFVPGIETAGLIDTLPIAWGGPDGSFEIEGRPLPPNPHDFPDAMYRLVSTGYFEAMSIGLRRGRFFQPADENADTPQVALVNQSFVREFFPNQEPIGQRIRFLGFDQKPEFMQIIGVVSNIHSLGLAKEYTSEVFADCLQHPGSLMRTTLVARGPLSSAASVHSVIFSLSRDVPVTFRAMDDVISESISRQRFQMGLLALFAGIALLLAAIGIYGVLSYTVNRRTSELGIRMALGANRRDLLRMILREGFVLTALGLAAGIAGALLLTRTLAGLLYGVSATDPLVFGAIAALLGTVAMIACFIPAHRAAGTDPMTALHYE